MDIGSTKLTSEDKRWIGAAVIVSILWLYLPFRFVSILNHIHQEAIEHPFLGIDSSDGPEGCFFTFLQRLLLLAILDCFSLA